MKVHQSVNAAAQLPLTQQTGPSYQALYDQGPCLFNEIAIHPQTGQEHHSLGGLEVSVGRLSQTLAKLKELGVQVDQ
jgi:hypothetical protein